MGKIFNFQIRLLKSKFEVQIKALRYTLGRILLLGMPADYQAGRMNPYWFTCDEANASCQFPGTTPDPNPPNVVIVSP